MDILDKTIKEIQEKQDFDRLEEFKNPRTWHQMREDQKKSLALLFVHRGAGLLDNDEKGKAFEAFSTAERLASSSAEVFLMEATALAKPKLKHRYHFLALEKGKKAVELAPDYFPAIARQARTNLELGIKQQDSIYLYEADRLFSEAVVLRNPHDDPDGAFYWMWGSVWHEIGKSSGEAIDFAVAVKKYVQAEDEGLSNPYFYNDYGNCLVEQGKLVNNIDLYLEAIEKFQAMTVLDPRLAHGWVNIAFLCEKLLLTTDDIQYFEEADFAYAKASEINEKDGMIWYRWGQLLQFTANRFLKSDLFAEAVAKFEKTESLMPDNADVIIEYADALSLLGSYEEDLVALQLAQNMSEKALQMDSKDPMKWYICGKCHIELAEYFHDERYYDVAIEKFLRGLDISNSASFLWYGLAKCYQHLGEAQNDPSMLDQSAKFFSRAEEFGGEMNPEFWADWGKTWLKIAELRKTKKTVKKALEKYERAIELSKYPETQDLIHPEILYHYSLCWCLYGELSQDEEPFYKSIEVLKQLLEVHPHFSSAFFNLGICYSHLGDFTGDLEYYEQAVDYYAKYQDYEPEDDALWTNWGITYLRILILTHDPAHPEYNERILRDAEEKLHRAVALGCGFAYYILACVHSNCSHARTAVEYLRKAHQHDSLPPLSELRHDPWLDELRDSSDYKEFIRWLENS